MELNQRLKDFIANQNWTFAKTYAKTWPHEYIVQERVNNELYLELDNHIDTHGFEGRFYLIRQPYFNYDGNTYWHMGNIINRCDENETFEKREAEGRLP